MAIIMTRELAVRSGWWSLLEGGGLTVLSFVALVVLSHLITAADFGLFSVTLGIVEILGLLSNMTFHDALVQHAGPTEKHYDTAFALALLIAVALCLGCWAAGPYYSQVIHDGRAGAVLTTMSLGMLVAGPVSPIVARQKRAFGFKLLALRSLVGRLAGFFLGIGMAWAGWGIWSLVVQFLAMQALGSLVLFATCDRLPRPGVDRTAAAQLLGFGGPAIGAQLVGFAIKRILVFGIGVFLGTQISGYVNIAMRIVDTLWSVTSTAVSQVGLSALTSLRHDPERRSEAYCRAMVISGAIFFPTFGGIAATAPEIVDLLFGQRWHDAAPFVTMFAIISMLSATRLFATPMMTAMGRPKELLRINSASLAFVVATMALSRLPTAETALAVFMASEAMAVTLLWRAVSRHGGVSLASHAKRLSPPLIAATAMGAIVVATGALIPATVPSLYRLAAMAASGITSYVGLLALADRALLEELLRLMPGTRSLMARSSQPTQGVTP